MVYTQLQGGDAPQSLIVSDLISGAWQLPRQQTSRLPFLLKQEKVNGVKKGRNLEWPKNLILTIELFSSFHQGAALYRLWGKKKRPKGRNRGARVSGGNWGWLTNSSCFSRTAPLAVLFLPNYGLNQLSCCKGGITLSHEKESAEETMMTPGDWCTLWVKRNLSVAWENNQTTKYLFTGAPEQPTANSPMAEDKNNTTWHPGVLPAQVALSAPPPLD